MQNSLGFVTAAALAAAMSIGSAHGAELPCTCQCIEGQLQTVCPSVELAQSRVDACRSVRVGCPAPSTPASDRLLESPAEAAGDCRMRRIYDQRAGEYARSAPVCAVNGDAVR
jgi:hypothetical protein